MTNRRQLDSESEALLEAFERAFPDGPRDVQEYRPADLRHGWPGSAHDPEPKTEDPRERLYGPTRTPAELYEDPERRFDFERDTVQGQALEHWIETGAVIGAPIDLQRAESFMTRQFAEPPTPPSQHRRPVTVDAPWQPWNQ